MNLDIMKTIFSIFVCFYFVSCACDISKGNPKNGDGKKADNESVLSRIKAYTSIGEVPMARKMYYATYRYEVGIVKKLLEQGASPNICDGEFGWEDSTPLAAVLFGAYSTYLREKRGDKILEPPDVEMVKLLVNAGANINERPYIWQSINNIQNNARLEMTVMRAELKGVKRGSVEMKERIEYYVKDANRLIEAFIKAGADVNKKGHSYPYNFKRTRGKITDEEANRYFARGTRPIDEAIKKGIVWESQVDLLLKYTKLDENSLKAAEESGDPKMIEKIDKLWKEQNYKAVGIQNSDR